MDSFHRNRPISLLCAVLALFAFAEAAMSSAKAEDIIKPNIVLFMVDDFGRELIGAYGGESHETPHIDRLALEGMAFEICYATPMCSPTRVMLMSGQYNFRNYDAWGEYPFGTDPTIANTLEAAGYATAVTGNPPRQALEVPLRRPPLRSEVRTLRDRVRSRRDPPRHTRAHGRRAGGAACERDAAVVNSDPTSSQ